ncbi:hypothetical protein MMC31_008055 [Peltigera leucophlebia]|nr:hypothetical protein [Peltigera leucophlebia]
MSAWVQALNAEPEKTFIPTWNSQRDIQYRPWRLLEDPLSEASRDKDFNSAFTNNPLKTWKAGVENPSTDLLEAIEEFRKLSLLCISYKGSCSDRECPVCKEDGDRPDGDRSDSDSGGNDNDNAKDSDDQEEDQNRKNKENEGGGDLGDDEGTGYEEDEEEDEEDEEDGEYGYESCSPQAMPRHNTRKKDKSRHHKKSSLYDTSVPYSYRKGYTWRGTTANELMAIWQGLPYIKHNNGQITLTQPRETRGGGG